MKTSNSTIRLFTDKQSKKLKPVLALLLVIALIGMIAVPAVAAAKPSYKGFSSVNSKVYMGQYSPGRLLISSSTVPDAGRNILDSMSLVCKILPGLPGCNFVKAANWFVAIKPDARYTVWLYDAGNKKFVWSGTLNGGSDIVLGSDHPRGYDIYLSPARLADCFTFVALVRK